MAEFVPVQTERPGLDAILKRHFGFPSFRPHQREIVESLLAGEDVVALLPTGGGKSLCYQLPAIAGAGLTVVVSPLIALMKDQVDSLEELGVRRRSSIRRWLPTSTDGAGGTSPAVGTRSSTWRPNAS